MQAQLPTPISATLTYSPYNYPESDARWVLCTSDDADVSGPGRELHQEFDAADEALADAVAWLAETFPGVVWSGPVRHAGTSAYMTEDSDVVPGWADWFEWRVSAPRD